MRVSIREQRKVLIVMESDHRDEVVLLLIGICTIVSYSESTMPQHFLHFSLCSMSRLSVVFSWD